MAPRRPPVFLERAGYRARRMMDAVRILTVVGIVLWMLPLLWPAGDAGETVAMSGAIFFIFGVWAVLIAVSAILTRQLGGRVPGDEDAATDPAAASDARGGGPAA